MHCLPNASGRRLIAWSIALLAPALAYTAPTASEPGFHVQNAHVRLQDGAYLLDASIDFDFSPESIEAMDNGVKLTIVLDIEVLKKHLLWHKAILKQQSRFRVGVHALSKRYVVRDLNSGETRTFRSVEEMADALGSVNGLLLFDREFLEAETDYLARVRARLDIEALPSPLRPLAYISPEWRLDGDWYEWSLNR